MCSEQMESKLQSAVQSIIKDGHGMVVLIGDTFTGKTTAMNSCIDKLYLQSIPFEFEEITSSSMKCFRSFIQTLKHSQSKPVSEFWKQTNQASSKQHNPQSHPKYILVCDAIESYSSSVLTFLKKSMFDSSCDCYV